jgi:hypothetical protein
MPGRIERARRGLELGELIAGNILRIVVVLEDD